MTASQRATGNKEEDEEQPRLVLSPPGGGWASRPGLPLFYDAIVRVLASAERGRREEESRLSCRLIPCRVSAFSICL